MYVMIRYLLRVDLLINLKARQLEKDKSSKLFVKFNKRIEEPSKLGDGEFHEEGPACRIAQKIKRHFPGI